MGEATQHIKDANENILTEAPALLKRMDYNASNLPLYIGWAVPGTAASAASWQITRMTYSGNNVTLIEFADSDTNFDNIWDSRTSLNYG